MELLSIKFIESYVIKGEVDRTAQMYVKQKFTSHEADDRSTAIPVIRYTP